MDSGAMPLGATSRQWHGPQNAEVQSRLKPVIRLAGLLFPVERSNLLNAAELRSHDDGVARNDSPHQQASPNLRGYQKSD